MTTSLITPRTERLNMYKNLLEENKISKAIEARFNTLLTTRKKFTKI